MFSSWSCHHYYLCDLLICLLLNERMGPKHPFLKCFLGILDLRNSSGGRHRLHTMSPFTDFLWPSSHSISITWTRSLSLHSLELGHEGLGWKVPSSQAGLSVIFLKSSVRGGARDTSLKGEIRSYVVSLCEFSSCELKYLSEFSCISTMENQAYQVVFMSALELSVSLCCCILNRIFSLIT